MSGSSSRLENNLGERVWVGVSKGSIYILRQGAGRRRVERGMLFLFSALLGFGVMHGSCVFSGIGTFTLSSFFPWVAVAVVVAVAGGGGGGGGRGWVAVSRRGGGGLRIRFCFCLL